LSQVALGGILKETPSFETVFQSVVGRMGICFNWGVGWGWVGDDIGVWVGTDVIVGAWVVLVGEGAGVGFGWETDLPRKKPPTPTRAKSKNKAAIKGGENLGVGEEKEGVTPDLGEELVWVEVGVFACFILKYD